MTQSDNNITVVLDTNLTPELIEEGFEEKSSVRSRQCVRTQALRLWTTSL